MSRAGVIFVLVLANLAGYLGGSAPLPDPPRRERAWAATGRAAAALDRLDIQSLDRSKIDTMLRDATTGLVGEYAESGYGFSADDLRLLGEGALVVPGADDLGSLNPTQLLSRVSSVRADLEDESLRAEQAVRTTVDAKAMQQYVEGMHASLEESFDAAVDLSKLVEDNIQLLAEYYRKFPSVTYAGT